MAVDDLIGGFHDVELGVCRQVRFAIQMFLGALPATFINAKISPLSRLILEIW
jgi:hypothetical protein